MELLGAVTEMVVVAPAVSCEIAQDKKGRKVRKCYCCNKDTRGEVEMLPMRAVLCSVGDFCLFLVGNSGLEQIISQMKPNNKPFRRLQVM